MNMKKLTIPLNRVLLLIVIFKIKLLVAQLDSQFIKHLADEKLKSEHFHYLQQNKTDSLYSSELCKYHLHYQEDSMFLSLLSENKHVLLKDTLFTRFSTLYFLNHSKSQLWFDLKKNNRTKIELEIEQIYNSSIRPLQYKSTEFPLLLQKSFSEYQRISHKKPIVSAALSTCVPGLGKLYIGNKKSFLNTFVFMSLMGVQTAESYRKLGYKHPLTLINTSFFLGYYASNIVGSFYQTKQKKKELKIQYLIHAENYYRNWYSINLY
jgi:hypothetical protein